MERSCVYWVLGGRAPVQGTSCSDPPPQDTSVARVEATHPLVGVPTHREWQIAL